MNFLTLRRRGFNLLELFVVVIILAILAAIVLPIINRNAMKSGHYGSCQSNLKQIMLGVNQYLQDHDEKYPILANSKAESGWANSLQPYLKSTQIFQCPYETIASNSAPAQAGYTDYWFNARMAGLREKQITVPSQTVSLGDGDSSNANYHLSEIPQSWRNNAQSPIRRHLVDTDVVGANYAFADGHVKWFSAKRWKTELDMEGGATLRLKPRN